MSALSPLHAHSKAHEARLCDLAFALSHLTLAALSDAAERQACYAHAGFIPAGLSPDAEVGFADDIEARRRATLLLRHCPPAIAAIDRALLAASALLLVAVAMFFWLAEAALTASPPPSSPAAVKFGLRAPRAADLAEARR